jgi:hypothetical protein
MRGKDSGDLPPATRPKDYLIPCKYLSRSQGWEGWLAPAALPKRLLDTPQHLPRSQDWEGWLAPATYSKDYLIPCKYLSRSQGWEGWLAPAALPKRLLNTLQVPLPISRLGRWACPRCVAQKIPRYSASTTPNLKVGKGGLPPATYSKVYWILRKHLP